jgi:triosephosphate isomerase
VTSRLFVANWKMHKTREECRGFAASFSEFVGERAPQGVELVLAPPFPSMAEAADARGRWSLAAQNVAAEREGAFTGEVSAAMAADAGCRWAIVGHSERRRNFGETEEILQKKLDRTREAGLVPIYCVGETAAERSAGATGAVLESQSRNLRSDAAKSGPLVVAYEPVWAIGTGTAATPADAAQAGKILRDRIGRPDIRLLYGGSVSPENAVELIAGSGMDGFLVGGASLDPSKFAAIAGLRRP